MFSHVIQKVSAKVSIDMTENKLILKNKGVGHILVVFQDRPMLSHIFQMVARAFH